MFTREYKTKIATFWLIQSIVVSSVVTYVLISYLDLHAPAPNALIDGAYALLWGLAVTGAFLMVFHYGVTNADGQLLLNPKYQLTLLFMAQGIAFGSYLKSFMSLDVLFMSNSLLHAGCTYFTFRMALAGYKIPNHTAEKLARFSSLITLSVAVLAWQLKNFWSLKSIAVGSATVYAVINFLGLLAITLAYSFHPRLRIDSSSAFNSFSLRIKSTHEGFGKLFPLVLFASFGQLIAMISLQTYSPIWETNYYLGSISFQILFVPGIIDTWMEVYLIGRNLDNLKDVSRLTSNSARKFLLRHNQRRDFWSAAVGLRTAFLHIEHDVERSLANSLPATFLRIRSDETSRIIETLMRDTSLLTHSTPDQVTCAIDPEHSRRPCLDALKLCATLYLDVGVVLQRRLQGLLALLPIINPGLAAAIDRDVAMSLLRKTKWFFYFDHLWIDQRILHTPASSQYGIQYDQISPELRVQLISYMNRLHAIGNFIWLSPQAKDRVIQELPSISGIFMPHEIESHGGKTFLMFSLKFEELIPRLQRYYALDQFRERIADFEPSKDSQKLLNILSLQVNNSNKSADCSRIIDVITSFKWIGFREKDLALRLLLSINNRVNELSESGALESEAREEIFSKLGSSISAIGYPSQLINQAHMYKIEIRNLEKLKRAALDPHNLSHLEAWATLSSLDLAKLGKAELSITQSIIKSAAKRSDLMSSPIIQARALECASNLLKIKNQSGQNSEYDLIWETINSIIRLKENHEAASLILDVLTHLNKTQGNPLQLPQNINSYFDNLSKSSSSKNNYWQQSVASSWQEFKSSYSDDRTTDKKVS